MPATPVTVETVSDDESRWIHVNMEYKRSKKLFMYVLNADCITDDHNSPIGYGLCILKP